MPVNSRTILLVEDNPSDVGLTQRAFEKSRISNDLVVAEDGQEALDYLWGEGRHTGRDTSELPSLMLLDLKLPKVPGLEVLRRIRADARTRRLPVVILTSSTQEQDVGSGYDLGVNGYIRKPVDFAQFVVAVGQLGFYWLILNEPPPKSGKAAERECITCLSPTEAQGALSSVPPGNPISAEDEKMNQETVQRGLTKARAANGLIVAEDGEEMLECLFSNGSQTGPDPSNLAKCKEEAGRAVEDRLSVLQIEDSESDAALIERFLERAGYRPDCKRVETAKEMRTALNRQPWDVIIADYHLPQFNAESALETLQSSGRDVPFIVVSGVVGEDVAVEMMKRGAHDFVMKGNLARLAPAIQREINEARTREQRKRADAALRRSEHEFRELAESIPQQVWMTNGAGETIYCNTRCQQQLGVGPTQPLCDQWAALLHSEDREHCLTAWEQCLRAAKEFHRECRLRMASSEYRWFLLRAIPVNDDQGHVMRWLPKR